MPKQSTVKSCLVAAGLMFLCCGGTFAWYVWDQFADHGSTSPPNVFEISPKVTGLISIISPRNVNRPRIGEFHLKIDKNTIIRPETISEGSGRWIAKIGTKTFDNLSAYGPPPTEQGVWSLGTVIAPEIPNHQVLNLYVGTASDALLAGKLIARKERIEKAVDAIKQHTSAK